MGTTIFLLYIYVYDGIDFHHSVFQINYLFFSLSYFAIDPFQCIFFLVIVLFTSVCSLIH